MKLTQRKTLFIAFSCLILCLAGIVSSGFLRNADPSEYYSHIPFVPVVVALLIFNRREFLFRPVPSVSFFGGTLIVAGGAIFLSSLMAGYRTDITMAVSVLGTIVLWWGSYLLFFRTPSGMKEMFPFCFILCAVPVPLFMIEKLVDLLVGGSSLMTHLIFKWIGVPFVQKGDIFYLPGFYIEIAKECSGIRSSIALFITAMLGGYLFLEKFKKLLILALAILPVAVLKNGFRIASLYLLSYFVDIRFIEGGFLHRFGGFIYFGLGLLILGAIIWVLRDRASKGESEKALSRTT